MGLAGFSHNSYSLDLVWNSWLIFVAVLPVGSGVREVFGELGAVGAGFKVCGYMQLSDFVTQN
ncbi:hypothetical protein CISIN_1g048201mg [Citrus sinensis]|uniref:Uncharacterized protein n=1 Tax=Citrus sinensis TaxID=2711 RepID=A0A067DHQ8_CITSI|nr:hypothetical protein CISIN_1g048201mg [Citrus sinensis]